MANDEIPRGQLPTIILSVLKESDKYGYEIIDTINIKTNGQMSIKQPSLYSCLRRMEEQGLISSYWRDSEIGGRRHYYSITDYGKKYAEKWKSDLNLFTLAQTNKKPTTAQQTNLFSNFKQEEKKEETLVNNSFVQYDLFSPSPIISEPSNDLFKSVQKNNEDNQFKQENVNNQIETNYVADSYNVNSKSIDENEIKQSFFELSKHKQSFTDAVKTNSYIDNEITDDEIEIKQQQTQQTNSINLQNNQNEKVENEMPTIFQNTFDYEENSNSNDISFIDLNNLSFDKSKQTQNQEIKKEDEILVNSENIDNNILYVTTAKLPNTYENKNVEMQNINTSPTKNEPVKQKDDAVYITEKADISALPKVRRIEPSKFENYARQQTELDKKVYTIYNNMHKKDVEEQEEYQPVYEEIQEEQKEQEIIKNESVNQQEPVHQEVTDLYSLKQYYKKLGIKFENYQSNSKNQKNLYVKSNKLNLYSYISISLIVILQSIICFCCLRTNQPGWNWIYLVCPILIVLGNIYFVIKYIQNKNYLLSKSYYLNYNWAIRIIISIIIFAIVISINLLCGLSGETFYSYLTTIIFPLLLLINYPLHFLINYILIKLNLVN